MQKKISLVSSGKLFFAFCVLGIHSGAFENSALRSYVFSLAVPFFFICSGYFLGVKINHINNLKEYQSVLNQYFKRLVVPYFIWGGVYFLVESLADVVTEGYTIWNAVLLRLHYWLVSSPGGGLWYVQTILILLLILKLNHKRKYRCILFWSLCILSMVPSTVDILATYSDTAVVVVREYNRYFLTDLNFVWNGLYFLAGIELAHLQIKNERIKGIIVFLILLMIKVVLSEAGVAHSFGRILNMLISAAIFMILFTTDAPYSKELSQRIRKASTIIYFTHILVKYMVQFAFKLLHQPETNMVFLISSIILSIYAYIMIKYFRNAKVYSLLY